MKVQSARGTLRAGLSGAAVLGLVVGAIALLGAGYLIGTLSSAGQESAASPAPPAPPALVAPDVTTEPPVAALARPEFRFEPESLDFGQVAIGESAEGSFDIVNTGTQPLTILAMRPSCSCTTLRDLAGVIVAPGARERVEARLDSRSYPSTARSQIRFLFDGLDPVEYELRARVTHPVEASPTYIQAQETRAGEFELRSTDGKAFRVLATHGDPPVFACGFEPRVDEPRQRYVLAWDLSHFSMTSCTDPDGRPMPRWWVVETDHPGAPVIDVRVRHAPCTVLELPTAGRRWLLSESRHVMGLVEPGSSHELTVSLRWLQNQAPNDTIRAVTSDSQTLRAELLDVSRQGDEITCRVRVTVHPDHRGLIYSEIRFHGFTEGHSAGLTMIGRADRTALAMNAFAPASPSVEGNGR